MNRQRRGNSASMILALSSGHSPLYRHDVLRGLALPRGLDLQLRYRTKWIHPDYLPRLEQDTTDSRGWLASGHPGNTEVVLYAYIDQAKKGPRPYIVPVRYGRLVRSGRAGNTGAVHVRVDDFVTVEDGDAFVDALYVSEPELPDWKATDDIQKDIDGLYLLPFPSGVDAPERHDGLDAWEKTVERVHKQTDFHNQALYYTVNRIREAGTEGSVCPLNAVFPLKVGTAYDLEFYHYHPKKAADPAAGLHLSSSTDSVEVVTPTLHVDTRYDLRSLRIQTAKLTRVVEGVLPLTSTKSVAGAGDERLFEFDVPVEVQPNWIRLWGRVGLIAAFLTLQAMVTLLLTDKLKPDNAWWVIPLTLLLNGVVGYGAVFNVKLK